jgi:protein-L-isoaspartate(D-aspartate) O-methyltransferase
MDDLARSKERLLQRYIDEGIANSRTVMEAFRKVPREEFVLPKMRESAYDDRPLPIACEQTISAPHYLKYFK